MALATNLGFPRLGLNRELKRALEAYWAGKSSREELLAVARDLRARHWRLQKDAGIDHVPSNDFTLYDHVLSTACLVGAVPERYGPVGGGGVDLDTFFAMARGRKGGSGAPAASAMEMTKWFDTNYHYIVPELTKKTTFRLSGTQPFDEFLEAKALGIATRPVLVGPFTFLALAKTRGESFDPLSLLPGLVPVYAEILKRLAALGAEWVQIDEPALAMDRTDAEREAFRKAYEDLRKGAGSSPRLLLAAYFEGLRENREAFLSAPVDAVHLDLVRAPEELEPALARIPSHLLLSLGVVDGRNVWKNDLSKSLELLRKAEAKIGGERLLVAPSCSLLHCPVDLDAERKLDPEVKGWMAFAKQKLAEVAALTRALNEGDAAVAEEIAASRRAVASRRSSSRIHDSAVAARLMALTPADGKRRSPYAERRKVQERQLGLPRLATTTIGSFPQTAEIRKIRRDFKDGRMGEEEYRQAMRRQIADVVCRQEAIGLDVLVHGEPERNDMVEYFGEQLRGFAFTENGWVQSYGSRGVKPPVLYGDVSRPRPMTVEWITYAQSLTKRPLKGMLTGPITILQWSFVRDDQPRRDSALQVALALRDEVRDLEAAGVRVIQIDEPALREGLPLRRADRAAYLEWAVYAFRVASSGVADGTQIHTHMCYSEFHDILEAIASLDADVLTIEASRSDMELLDAFRKFRYPNEIGPGVYDIHSPRIPGKEEIAERLRAICGVLPPERVWVNPDCGLKTRAWEEVEPSLRNMVAAAREVRESLLAAP